MTLETGKLGILKEFIEDLDRSLEEKAELLEGLVRLGEGLIKSEAHLIASLEAARNGKSLETPDGASLEWARALDWLHNTPPSVAKRLKANKEVEALWYVLGEVLPKPKPDFSKEEDFKDFTEQDGYHVDGEGDIWGFGPYQQLDVDWSISFVEYLTNLVDPGRIAGFGWKDKAGKEVPAKAIPMRSLTGAQDIRIAIIGDWGTGLFNAEGKANAHDGLGKTKGPAYEVIKSVLDQKPDYIIHLGDVYYAGTDGDVISDNEERDNFLDMLTVDPAFEPVPKDGMFMLNSNHEQYGAAKGLFNVAMNRSGDYSSSPFQQQNGRSFFALYNDDWFICGLDSAYYNRSLLYMEGSLGNAADSEQKDFIQNHRKPGQKVVIMTHHTGLHTTGKKRMALWKEINIALGGDGSTSPENAKYDPDYWYWGHTHLGIAYNTKTETNKSAAGPKTLARCIGHSAIPFGTATDLEPVVADGTVAYFANTPVGGSDDGIIVKNGYCIVTLKDKTLTEAFYDAGSAKPSWTKP